MSTAGKVLSVLVALSLLGGIFLAAKVADLNSNWGEAVAKERAKVEGKAPPEPGGLIKDLADARDALARLKADTAAEQSQTDRDLLVLRRRLAAIERTATETKEALAGVKFQLARVEATVADARNEVDLRTKERVDLEKAKADTEALVEQIKGRNGELLAQLLKLREDFTKTLAENRELLGRATR